MEEKVWWRRVYSENYTNSKSHPKIWNFGSVKFATPPPHHLMWTIVKKSRNKNYELRADSFQALPIRLTQDLWCRICSQINLNMKSKDMNQLVIFPHFQWMSLHIDTMSADYRSMHTLRVDVVLTNFICTIMWNMFWENMGWSPMLNMTWGL